MAQTMDDMVFQCNNQNSIYVLNASYGAYGDYGTYAATKREINGSQSRAANPIEATCPSGGGGVVLQHKFKTFGTPTTTASEGGGVDATAGSASNYVNPVATSMSTAMCSPATAALQKLFNCSVGGACHDVPQTHAQAMGQIQDHSHITSHHSSSNSNSNNNAPASSHNNSCLSAAGGVTQNGRNRSRSGGESLDGTAGVTAAAGAATGGLPLLPKKKCTNVKSALIAKKTKFLKYLEEEKWRSNAAAAATATEDAGAISNEAEPPNNNGGNLKNQSNSREAANRGGSGSGSASGSEQRQLNKLSNWSMHNEDNNATAPPPAALTSQQQPAKSSFELYQEAADILGLSCSLCDNCRCLDCQSGYFDCDDDDESYSEQSLMDDEYEFEFDCTAEELQAALTGRDGDRELEPCCQLPHNRASPPHTQPESVGPRLAIDFDLINATCSQVLQNCETFNELSLLDATAAAAGVERPYT